MWKQICQLYKAGLEKFDLNLGAGVSAIERSQEPGVRKDFNVAVHSVKVLVNVFTPTRFCIKVWLQ